jgi:hypothetical protein
MQRKLGVVLAAALVLGTVWGAGTAFATHTFPDVPDGAFYADAVEWAAANGITTGVGTTGKFQPDAPTTRGQMVTFLKRLNDLRDQHDLWAIVRSDGTLARGSHVASTARIAVNGWFEVLFDRDVTGCSYQATIGDPGTTGPNGGVVSVAARGGKPHGVWIRTADTGDTPTYRGFHLAVFC